MFSMINDILTSYLANMDTWGTVLESGITRPCLHKTFQGPGYNREQVRNGKTVQNLVKNKEHIKNNKTKYGPV